MASVIRIKRRRNDDPAEALILSHKKSKISANPDDELNVTESVLEFAGTITSKDEPVSKHIKEAIRKKKIHKEMHPHFSDVKTALRTDMTSKLRKQKAESSQNNRYRITYSRRALDIDKLDSRDNDEMEPKPELVATSHAARDGAGRLKEEENKENTEKTSRTLSHSDSQTLDEVTSSSSNDSSTGSPSKKFEVKSPADICSNLCGASTGDKVFCLIDVEHENSVTELSSSNSITEGSVPNASSEITVNGVPMKQIPAKVPIAEESDDYVYDLYFTHTRLSDIRNEAVVTVEALCNEFLHDDQDGDDDDNVYDDDDDSNDEGNWRNDYPDEDPYFFENADRDYDYRNDMRESIFNGGDDERDLLSYWMDTRCRVGANTNSDSEDEYGRDGHSSEEEGY